MTAKKKKPSEGVEILNVTAAPGEWVAVVDEEHAHDVAAWATTSTGVVGLISHLGHHELALAPEDCVGYVQKLVTESAKDAAARYLEQLETDDPEDEEDEDEDPEE